MLKPEELRDKTVEDLKLMFGDLSKEIFELKNEMRITRKIEKPHLLKEKKKDRARVATILRLKD